MEYLIIKLEDGRYALATTVAILTEQQLRGLCHSGMAMIEQEPKEEKKENG